MSVSDKLWDTIFYADTCVMRRPEEDRNGQNNGLILLEFDEKPYLPSAF